MGNALFIAGDWGTSNLRLTLCRGGTVLDRACGPGIGIATQEPERLFLALTAPWRSEHGALPVLLCGVVGSRTGWIEAPYAPCPSGLDALHSRMQAFTAAGHRIAIVPGLACVNPLGAPDVMRGEETQLLGALAAHPELRQGRRLFALPGTHTKWVVVEDGRVLAFLTSPVGELFALLRAHSTLSVSHGEYAHDAEGFALGLERAMLHGAAGMQHLLFEARSRQLREGMSGRQAMGFLSGLLIGTDVAGALGWFDATDDVVLIGTPMLNGLYAQALERQGVRHRGLDGQQCALDGLNDLFRHGALRDVA